MNFYGDYERKFNSEVPKKQAKSYEIDLGQNNGPYKEDLLIRYGDHSLHQIISKKNNTNMNMQEIMMMNDVLKPFQERVKDNTEDNMGSSLINIEAELYDVEDESDRLRELEENVNKLIEMTTNDIFKMFDDTYNEFNPELLSKYKFLKMTIKDQKDENANLLKQIDLLNQEISTIFENIIKLGSRLDSLEKTCGVEKIDIDDEDEEDDD